MIPELGHFALIIALCFSVFLCVLPAMGVVYARMDWVNTAKPFAYLNGLFVFFAYSALSIAFLQNDFTVLYVANNSSIDLPWFYRLCAVWGAHEGSMLLWSSMLSAWIVAVALFSQQLSAIMRARVLAILGMINTAFLLFLLFTSNPFLRLFHNVPQQGRDLNPLLQDLGFLFHPPMLYMGYVGFAVAFALAISALWAKELNPKWARWSRSWTLAAWSFLTLGITLGSWWSYRELGWGGWWAWDPVENASFLPWLMGTALLHSLAVSEKRDTFKAWTVLLAILTFSLSLLGTFLLRSGVLSSIHAFAVDPKRGLFMLAILCLVVSSALSLYAWRMNDIRSCVNFSALSRESFLLMNNVLLMVVAATILLGTLYPLIIDALGYGKLSVGAPYFNSVFIPLAIPFLLLMGVGPLARWRLMQPIDLFKRLLLVASISLPVIVLIFSAYRSGIHWQVMLGMGLAIWILVASIIYVVRHYVLHQKVTRKQITMLLAHGGIAISLMGITLSSYYSQERFVRVNPGQTTQLAAYQLNFKGITQAQGPNYTRIIGHFLLLPSGQNILAEKRIYDVSRQAMTDAGINVNWWRDVYIALGESFDDGSWSVRFYYKPFIRWIWLGGILMLLAGLIGFIKRKSAS